MVPGDTVFSWLGRHGFAAVDAVPVTVGLSPLPELDDPQPATAMLVVASAANPIATRFMVLIP
jgi:hypothetical protein